MIRLTKFTHASLLLHNEKDISFHRLKIYDIIKLLRKNKDIKQDDLDKINVQLINTINHINPQQSINNIIHHNKKDKEDFIFIKKKIYFNHLLLKTIVNRNDNNFLVYECKEDVNNSNNTEIDDLQLHENIGNIKKLYGRNKRKFILNRNLKSMDPINEDNDNTIFYNDIYNNSKQKKNIELINGQNLNITTHATQIKKKNINNFQPFELKKFYSCYVLDSILRHVCLYIYNYKILNKMNEELKNGYELVSALLMANIFYQFFELKFGYTLLVHFLNGLKVYKIKKKMDFDNMSFELINGYLNGKSSIIESNRTEMNSNKLNITDSDITETLLQQDKPFEKEDDIFFIIDYLNTYIEKNEHEYADCNNKINDKDKLIKNENNCYIYKFEESKDKKIKYVVDSKNNILLCYNINISYLNYFLNIISNKYNINKINFNNYCLLLHMYSMSNNFVTNFFASFPTLFLKNKTYLNINMYIVLLNSCIFFLKGNSFINMINSFCVDICCADDSGQSNGYSNIQNNGYSNIQNNGYSNIQNNGYSNIQNNGYSNIQNNGYSNIQNNGYSNIQNNGYSNIQNNGYIHKNNNKLIEKTNSDAIDLIKDKIYALVEQIINYLFINKEIINNNQLLLIFEILSFINYNKQLFSFIFNRINNNLLLLPKYQLFYFLNSLSSYDIRCNETKKKIYNMTVNNINQYTHKEIKLLESYLQVKY
ncbi:conserved protein, unknown function [Hepatocystis sp. ex Piliocolobus tephrosceles]|nr:conserved protein, unknown function [Hepatocystis sp. ex Piliocolobus tephrosceles]